MKKLVWLMILASTAAFGQAARYDSVALNPRGAPIPNATITLCSGTATGVPCSPNVQSFTDITLTTTCASGFPVVQQIGGGCSNVTDGNGNFGFWLNPGTYKYSISGPQVATPQTYTITVPAGATSGGSGSTSILNNTCNANLQTGADLGAKINTCLSLGFQDILVSASGTISTQVLINNTNNIAIHGIGSSAATVFTNGITGTNAACAIKITGTSTNILLQDIYVFGNSLTGASGNGNGICIVGTGPKPALITLNRVYSQFNKGTGVDGTGASINAAGVYVFKSIDVRITEGSYGGNNFGIVFDNLVNNAQIQGAGIFGNATSAVQLKNGVGHIIIGPYNDIEGNGTNTTDKYLDLDGCDTASSLVSNWIEANNGFLSITAVSNLNNLGCDIDVSDNVILHGFSVANPSAAQLIQVGANVDLDFHDNHVTANAPTSITTFMDITPSTIASIGKRIHGNIFDMFSPVTITQGLKWEAGTQLSKCDLSDNAFGSFDNATYTGTTMLDVPASFGCRAVNTGCYSVAGTITNCVKIEASATNTITGQIATGGGATFTNVLNDGGTSTNCIGQGCPAQFNSSATNAFQANGGAGKIFAQVFDGSNNCRICWTGAAGGVTFIGAGGSGTLSLGAGGKLIVADASGHIQQSATGQIAGTCAMAAATSCTFTIGTAFSSAPVCIATAQGTNITGGAVACSVSTTTVTITAAAANSNTWGALLIGNPN